MDTEILKGIGLSELQVSAYLALLEVGELSPPELAKKISITRTNAYSVLDQLQQKNLASKVGQGNKIIFVATHPTNLEAYVERRRNTILNWEYKLNSIMPGLVKDYYSTTDQPAVRYFQGREALEYVYADILKEKAELYLIATPNQHDFLGEDFIKYFVKSRVKHKIVAHILSPLAIDEKHNTRDDKAKLIDRYWYDAKLFDVPVEISIYGDKVAYLSFGEEVIGTIIHSPQIAQAQRELFNMIKLASKTR